MFIFVHLRHLIKALAVVSGIAIMMMMAITVADVLLRLFGIGITGAYDLVRVCGAIAVSCALPYLTAVKGHIAIEFFYHKLSRRGRIALDTLFRLFSLLIFGTLAWRVFLHGLSLLKSGEVFPNLGIPVFWIPMVISLNCVLMMVVFVYHLLHPGKEYIKP